MSQAYSNIIFYYAYVETFNKQTKIIIILLLYEISKIY